MMIVYFAAKAYWMNKFGYYIVLLLWLPAAFSCKKDAGHHSNSCKVVYTYDSVFSSTGTYASSTRIVYDNEGRIAYSQIRWPTDSATRVFTYRDSSIIVNPTTDRMSFDTIRLDGKGRPAEIIVSFVGFPSTHLTYMYDPAGLLQSSTAGPTNKTTTTYQYEHGDCVSATSSDGSVTTYTYYTDKPAADVDPIRFGELFNYGVIITHNAHLTRTIQYGQTISEYSYTFDNTGKITNVTSRYGAQVNTSKYVYDCSQ